MSRYETRCLTWQYFSLSGIRLTPGSCAFFSFLASRAPLVFSILLACSGELVVGWAPVVPNTIPNSIPNFVLNLVLNLEPLLNYHFLLAGIHRTFVILRGNGDQAFPVRQGRRKIPER